MHTVPTHPIIGIDIGGTTTRLGAFPAPDTAPDRAPLATFDTSQDYDEELARIGAALSGSGPYAGVGVSFGGRIARDGSGVAVAPNLRAYEGRPFIHDIARLAGCPVRLAHDPVCGLLAEARYGVLRGADRCAYLTLSTGTGAAVRLAKAEAALTTSIEFGHQILAGNDRPCPCGQVGCLETYTGGRQLAARFGRPLEEITDEQVWSDLASMLAIGLVNLAQLSRVELVAVSGGIALRRPSLVANVRREVAARLRGMALRVVLATLGEHAPLVGAALLLSTPDEVILH